MMYLNEFALFDNFNKEELQEYISDIKLNIIEDIINKNTNNENIYELLEYIEYYQYKKTNEFIIHLQTELLQQKIILDTDKIKYRIKESIFSNKCVNNYKSFCIESNIYIHPCCYESIKCDNVKKFYMKDIYYCINNNKYNEIILYLLDKYPEQSLIFLNDNDIIKYNVNINILPDKILDKILEYAYKYKINIHLIYKNLLKYRNNIKTSYVLLKYINYGYGDCFNFENMQTLIQENYKLNNLDLLYEIMNNESVINIMLKNKIEKQKKFNFKKRMVDQLLDTLNEKIATILLNITQDRKIIIQTIKSIEHKNKDICIDIINKIEYIKYNENYIQKDYSGNVNKNIKKIKT